MRDDDRGRNGRIGLARGVSASIIPGLKRAAGTPGLAIWRRLSSRYHELARGHIVASQLATARDRLLPNAIILGAQKGGTTTLFDLLARHPLVLTSCTKEVHFFDLHQARGINWYRAHFPLARQRDKLASRGLDPVVLEASPYYLFHPAVPGRLAQALPHARLIVLLRDPVARAWSHYWHERTRGYEWRSPEAAFKREPRRLAGEEERLLADPAYRSHVHRHFSYLGRSRYAAQLERWLALFAQEQILVLRSEDLFSSPATTVAQVLRFLGLPQAPELVRRRCAGALNVGCYCALPRALGERLRAQFEPANAALQTLLGLDFSW
jgi:hypothetical protein